MVAELSQLTDELVMLQVRHRQRAAVSGRDIWSDTLRPYLVEIAHKPDNMVSGLETDQNQNQEGTSSLCDVNTTP